MKIRLENTDQKTLLPFFYITMILIGIDVITTVIGLELGLEEGNFIPLMFIRMFGSYYGLLISIVGKYVVVIFPMIVYQYVEKGFETTFLKNIYWIFYLIILIIAIITTLRTDINNIIAIIGQLQYQDYIHSL